MLIDSGVLTDESLQILLTLVFLKAYQAFKAHSTLPTEELLAPAVLSVAKSTLAIEVGARCGMASLMAMPWIAEGMRRFLPEQVKARRLAYVSVYWGRFIGTHLGPSGNPCCARM